MSSHSPASGKARTSDNPAQRLLEHGAASLSDLETALLALGWKSEPLRQSLSKALAHFGTLRNLTTASQVELARIRGVGGAKAAQLVALFEFHRRIAREPGRSKSIASPSEIYDMLAADMAPLTQESVRAVLLDHRKQVIRVEEIFRGTANECFANPPEILRVALAYAARAFVLVHNHPSGDPSPSKTDHATTRTIGNACQVLSLEFVDHVIIGQPSENGRQPYFSFLEAGHLPIDAAKPEREVSTLPGNVIPFPSPRS